MAKANAGNETISGASTGAQIGTKIMPGWGTAIGAVIGGITGATIGKKKARRRNRAMRLRKELEFQTNFRNRQAAIRQYQAQQASILAMATAFNGAGVGSSVTKGAQYGLYGSLQEELKFNAVSWNMQQLIQKNEASAANIENMFSALTMGLQQNAGAFGSRGTPSGPTSSGGSSGGTSPAGGDMSNTGFNPAARF